MKEASKPRSLTDTSIDGASRLLELVGRSVPPHRSVDGLVTHWYETSGSLLDFDEWADPAAVDLLAAFDGSSDAAHVESAVVRFAQARAGADHPATAVADDLVALIRVAWPVGRGTWGEDIDPVELLARAVGAWAVEREAEAFRAASIDPITGLVGAAYVRERVHELHDQCCGLAIAPQVTFGALVVQLELGALAATERMQARVAAGRRLAERFRAGETVGALSPSRLVVLMPAYVLRSAVATVAADFDDPSVLGGAEITVRRVAFAHDPASTFESLAGTSGGP